MCDQTEIRYGDGDIVWVKFHNYWWPGEVHGTNRVPEHILKSFRRMPIAIVKFFQEEAYEYVKNIKDVYQYNCIRKNEFIKKGLGEYKMWCIFALSAIIMLPGRLFNIFR